MEGARDYWQQLATTSGSGLPAEFNDHVKELLDELQQHIQFNFSASVHEDRDALVKRFVIMIGNAFTDKDRPQAIQNLMQALSPLAFADLTDAQMETWKTKVLMWLTQQGFAGTLPSSSDAHSSNLRPDFEEHLQDGEHTQERGSDSRTETLEMMKSMGGGGRSTSRTDDAKSQRVCPA